MHFVNVSSLNGITLPTHFPALSTQRTPKASKIGDLGHKSYFTYLKERIFAGVFLLRISLELTAKNSYSSKNRNPSLAKKIFLLIKAFPEIIICVRTITHFLDVR